MCENPGIMSKTKTRKLEERLLIGNQMGSGKLNVDESYAYFNGKAVSKERWRMQSIQIGLPPDIYLDVASLAESERGYHSVNYNGQKFLVGIGGLVQSKYGPHAEVVSMASYS